MLHPRPVGASLVSQVQAAARHAVAGAARDPLWGGGAGRGRAQDHGAHPSLARAAEAALHLRARTPPLPPPTLRTSRVAPPLQVFTRPPPFRPAPLSAPSSAQDADLIMLGLATHAPAIVLLREKVRCLTPPYHTLRAPTSPHVRSPLPPRRAGGLPWAARRRCGQQAGESQGHWRVHAPPRRLTAPLPGPRVPHDGPSHAPPDAGRLA